jgi:hypothetical protein
MGDPSEDPSDPSDPLTPACGERAGERGSRNFFCAQLEQVALNVLDLSGAPDEYPLR